MSLLKSIEHRAKYLKFAPDPVPLVGRASVPAEGSRFAA